MNVCENIIKLEILLESQFSSDADASGIIGVKGHRSVGGLRFSIYNAGIQECPGFQLTMKKFRAQMK